MRHSKAHLLKLKYIPDCYLSVEKNVLKGYEHIYSHFWDLIHIFSKINNKLKV